MKFKKMSPELKALIKAQDMVENMASQMIKVKQIVEPYHDIYNESINAQASIIQLVRQLNVTINLWED